jgi:hypothetical protein
LFLRLFSFSRQRIRRKSENEEQRLTQKHERKKIMFPRITIYFSRCYFFFVSFDIIIPSFIILLDDSLPDFQGIIDM